MTLKTKLTALRRRSETIDALLAEQVCLDPIERFCLERDIERAVKLLESISRGLMGGFEDTASGVAA